ncbi:MAG TPA: hypothetical protein VKY90_18600 [Candidatus Dormibacteraeota bacterium]|nr:hypothetical protein [Candidatus Dormibacteraeota bacterium]
MGRRSASNWAVRTLKADLDTDRERGAPRSRLRGDPVGFPRLERKGRAPDRCPFSTGTLRVEPDRRHVTLPKIGTVRTCESTRRRERLVRLGRGRIPAATLRRVGERAVVVLRVELQRPQGCPTRPRWPGT